MIFKWFIKHQWLEMTRSSIWQRSLVLNIVIGFLLFLMLVNFLFLGLLIDEILEELYPNQDPIVIFNGIILHYLGIELFLRFMVQNLPVLNIETYLHLPIKRSSIVHYVSSKSIVAFGNYLPWLVAIPFALKVVAPAYSLGTACLWLGAVVILVFANNFLATFIKRQLTGKPIIVGIFGLLILSLVLLDYFDLISLSAVSSSVFGELLVNPVWVIVPVLLLLATYSLNYFYLKSRLYPEEVIIGKKNLVDSHKSNRYLESKGLVGQLVFNDLRLIWRHKRTKSLVIMAPLFLLYGFAFYPQDIYRDMSGMLIFVGIFMTGGMMLNYTNYCFSYESNFFDNILSNYKDFYKYLKVKYLFAVAISTVCYILTIPYVFFGPDILLINTMTFLYNIGILAYVLLYFATFSSKRMDLSKGAAFNYQGLGASHWLAMIPAFLMPVLIYLPFSLAGFPTAGLIFIGAMGLAGLLFHKYFMNILLKQFLKKKYKMAEGFRE